jgi:hypothetical protein
VKHFTLEKIELRNESDEMTAKESGIVHALEKLVKNWTDSITKAQDQLTNYPKTKARLNLASDYIINLLEPIPLTAEILERNGFYWGYTSSEEYSISNMPEDIPIPLIMPDKHWCYDNEDGGEVTIELPNESDEMIAKERIIVHALEKI